jgi:ribonucleoside-diphosphate reductase alpha chain
MPFEATVEDIADAYTEAWRLGVKALAIYRDGSKTAQALRTDAQQGKDAGAAAGEDRFTQAELDAAVEAAVEAALGTAVGAAHAQGLAQGREEALETVGPKRKRMPVERQSITHKFSLGGHEGYITAGMYEDGTVGEIFLTDIGKEGSTLRGMMNSFATAISISLQYGVPLETLVQKFAYMRFEPEGITANPEIPFAKSMPDYIMRWLASRFLDADTQEALGIMTPAVRARQSAQDAASSYLGDTSGPAAAVAAPALGNGNGNGGVKPAGNGNGGATVSGRSGAAAAKAPTSALTDTPPVRPAVVSKSPLGMFDIGAVCDQCGGTMQRTGACMTCSSCGNNTGCG